MRLLTSNTYLSLKSTKRDPLMVLFGDHFAQSRAIDPVDKIHRVHISVVVIKTMKILKEGIVSFIRETMPFT